ncbi:hypothetical protein N7535_002043 [Penicillium sp. DV-2018c]|nr:hypothetical protein N7461_004713 [Penicillium sp. DV-2018c]KAJ5583423.1 hypothetical protein N7535_002043 [Penicillium sp. DV-2018c]
MELLPVVLGPKITELQCTGTQIVCSDGDMWLGGSNRRVAIINPDTGRPIEIPGQPLPTGHIANDDNVPNERNRPLVET